MNKLKFEYILLILAGFLMLAILFWPVLTGSSTLDIHLHDTYFVIEHFPVAASSLWYCIFLFALYTVTRRKTGNVNGVIALFHILVTTVVISFYVLKKIYTYETLPRRYLDFSGVYTSFSREQTMLIALMGLFVVAQLAFFTYAIVSLVQNNGKKNDVQNSNDAPL